MLANLIHKARQLSTDPVLRRWAVGRVLGRRPGEPAFTPHKPPYLDGHLPLAAGEPRPGVPFAELVGGQPAKPLELALPGQAVRLEPRGLAVAFRPLYADPETRLAMHRFAWLPLAGEEADPAWVQALWSAWRGAYGTPSDDWPWHPYTAAERAVNIVTYGRRHGLPAPVDDTLAVLAAHGPAIANRLEYRGDHHTANHLCNNGRGLYLLGLALGEEAYADIGLRVLLGEAERLFLPSGVMREGSSHYHLLVTHWFAECWLAASAHGRTEEERLRDITARALAVVPRLLLPGGLPLIGDISPDAPPGYVMGMAVGAGGWVGSLDPEARAEFVRLRDAVTPVAAADLAADGWLRADVGPWAGLWHAAPGGWPPMPGHGHQDMGGFEAHYQGEPVLVDPGRGAYGEWGKAAFYRSGRAHNTIIIDGADPYPTNKPYYDDAFRLRVGGPPPELDRDGDDVVLRHHGFARLSGVGAVTRRWRFSDKALSVIDTVEGSGQHTAVRVLYTDLPVRWDHGTAVLAGDRASYRIRIGAHDFELTERHAERWTAYGVGHPATALVITVHRRLPWTGAITVEID